MDFHTLFVTYLASLLVYAGCATLLALHNRNVQGLSWMAGGLLISVVKFFLQGLEGKIPVVFSSLVANELYLLSFILQMLGLRWFVTRNPLRSRWALWVTGCLAGVYTVLYFLRIPYIANLINLPIIAVIGVTGVLLLRRGKGIFLHVSRWTAAFLFGEMLVSLYRAILTNLVYARPWLVIDGQHDPRWLYSLLAMTVFSTCVIMCSLWMFVVELQGELLEQARTDPLTGALNRRALYIEADWAIARSLRSGRPLCVLLFDIDDFKAINDAHGHAAGDYVLQNLVTCVRNGLRQGDLLARSGGEEFTVILPETGRQKANLTAERLRASLDTLSLNFDDTRLHISVSIGVAELAPACDAFEGLLRRADSAMYEAKISGKNRTIVYESQRTGNPRMATEAGSVYTGTGLAQEPPLPLPTPRRGGRSLADC